MVVALNHNSAKELTKINFPPRKNLEYNQYWLIYSLALIKNHTLFIKDKFPLKDNYFEEEDKIIEGKYIHILHNLVRSALQTEVKIDHIK